ncbi:hypothetical protein [Marinimicrobium sp. ABcell2]|uniref:hypothetical protein n=1 Tax=Marinimicrobium sp. ABcell2 TaxID=3069751 RepID=UPI0027AE81DB|nr:hypothetical protein [Marinimicrobium sp. ABcell2]MDQ2076300.1 hypothetical protein [Marinimicrobium sp. ABcell2]
MHNNFQSHRALQTQAIQTPAISGRVSGIQAGGMAAGLIACVLAVLGTVTLANALLPLSAFAAIFGTIQGLKGRCAGCIGVNLLAGALAIFGMVTSPELMLAGL